MFKPLLRTTLSMKRQQPFKWRHFLPEVILMNVRWYSRYSLSYRDLEEMMLERGVEVDIRPFTDGSKLMPLNWTNAFGLIWIRLTTPGKWMRPISKSKKHGSICTGLLTQRARPWTLCSAPNETQKPLNGSLPKSSMDLIPKLLELSMWIRIPLIRPLSKT